MLTSLLVISVHFDMKKTLAIATAVAAAVSAAPVTAHSGPKARQVNAGDHQELIRALGRSGVRVVINDPNVCTSRNIDGRYVSIHRRLDICQDHANKPYRVVRWTNNDLNTLRHEAHHVIQDCADGRKWDGSLIPVFRGDEYRKFVGNALTERQARSIATAYTRNGATRRVVIMELEAFAVAETVSPSQMAYELNRLCS